MKFTRKLGSSRMYLAPTLDTSSTLLPTGAMPSKLPPLSFWFCWPSLRACAFYNEITRQRCCNSICSRYIKAIKSYRHPRWSIVTWEFFQSLSCGNSVRRVLNNIRNALTTPFIVKLSDLIQLFFLKLIPEYHFLMYSILRPSPNAIEYNETAFTVR